jgi:hypothetical protein
MVYREIKQSNVANGINKITTPIVGHSFLGLLEISDTDDWGQTIENRNFCAAHLRLKIAKIPLSANTEKEDKQIENGYTNVVYLAGLGKKTYIKRFKSKEEATAWIYKTGPINKDQDGSLLVIEG